MLFSIKKKLVVCKREEEEKTKTERKNIILKIFKFVLVVFLAKRILKSKEKSPQHTRNILSASITKTPQLFNKICV